MASPNTYVRIASRSGLAKRGIDVGAGVVDADYRGEIQALLINNSTIPFQVEIGDRIAQLILERIVMANPSTADGLPSTARGTQGFGSTGTSTLLTSIHISALRVIQFDQDFLGQVRTAGQADPEYREWGSNPIVTKEKTIQDGLIYFQNRLHIPDDQPLRLQIAASEHDSQVAGHFSQKKALKLFSR